MAISVSVFQQFNGFAIAAEDVQIGEAETIDIDVVRNGQFAKVPLKRLNVVVTIRGVNASVAQPYIDQATNNATALLFGAAVAVQDLAFGSQPVRSAYLKRAVASPVSIQVNGINIIETLKLEYESLILVA